MLYNTRRTGTPPGRTENLWQSSTCSLGMGVAIQKTYENGPWNGRSHPAKETKRMIRYGRSHPWRLRYGRSHPSMSHVMIIHKIAAWTITDKGPGSCAPSRSEQSTSSSMWIHELKSNMHEHRLITSQWWKLLTDARGTTNNDNGPQGTYRYNPRRSMWIHELKSNTHEHRPITSQ